MNEKTREDIASFRYNQIYPLLQKSYLEDSQQAYLENYAQQAIHFPDGSKRHIRPGTLRDWLRNYKNHGFDGLKPKSRLDSGFSRSSLTTDQRIEALRLKQENPRRTDSSIRRMMIKSGFFPIGACSESTIQRFFRKNKHTIQRPEDNGLNVQQTLKKAIDTYGVPQRLYTDKGKPYRNRQLELICANLGIGLNHAAPYHGNAKAVLWCNENKLDV